MERFTLKRGRMALLRELRRPAKHRVQDPEGERADDPGVLGDAHEGSGHDRPRGGMAPAKQRLGGDRDSGGEVDLRLVVDFELVGADGALQVDVEAVVDLGLDAVLALEDVVTLLARPRDPARHVGGHQQLPRVGVVFRHRGDAHAGPQHGRSSLVGDRPIEGAQALHGGEHRLGRVGDARQDDADLLLVQRGQPVLRPQCGPQALEDERERHGGGRPFQQGLQAVDAAKLHDQDRKSPVRRLRDGRLAIEEAQQVLAWGDAGQCSIARGIAGRRRQVHER